MPAPFVETDASREVLRAIQWAGDRRYPALVTGRPGTGKTSALLHYREDFGAIYFEVDEASKSPAGLIQRLTDALEIRPYGKARTSLYERTRAIEQEIRHWGRSRLMARHTKRPLIFVDEQQKFEAPTLRDLLRICETTECALVLAGNRERLTKSRPSEQGALDQIHSRIGLRVQLDTPTFADCRAIAVAYNVEGITAYDALAAFGEKTNFRELVRLLEEAEALVDGRGIDLASIETAAIALYGDRKALLSPPAII